MCRYVGLTVGHPEHPPGDEEGQDLHSLLEGVCHHPLDVDEIHHEGGDHHHPVQQLNKGDDIV